MTDHLLVEVLNDLASRRLPESTYRLQLHAGFTFQDATAIVPYLHELGITDCYASPFLKARSGSHHGYDITDHRSLNPEIGSPKDFAAWTEMLKSHGMGLILDTVPNHMAVVGNENIWWNDVLENGPASPYAGFFDIAWSSSPRPELQGRILIPILGEAYGQVLEAQQLRLHYGGGAFSVHYFDHHFPVAPRSYGLILGHRVEDLERRLGPEAPALHEYQSILTAVKHLPRSSETAPALVAERQREKEIIKRRLAALTSESAPVREFLEKTIIEFNGQSGDPRSFELLEDLLDDQIYRLANWRVAADEINYRRFFDINELAALSMEREEVFTATHELILMLLSEGKVTGLRIDHPDGLFDPRQYLHRLQLNFVLRQARKLVETHPESWPVDWKELEEPLREKIAAALSPSTTAPDWPLYVVVEKILGAEEALPADWPTHGTSGYEFLNQVNGLFVDAAGKEPFSRLYLDLIHDDTPLSELIYQKKILILQIALSSELQMLSHQLDRLAQKNRWSRDFTHHGIRQALREIIACFPVYRSYIAAGAMTEIDLKHVVRAVRRAMSRNPALSTALFQFIRDMLMLRPIHPTEGDADFQAELWRFAGKFQQVTSPVMAKGVEDTAFYVFNRLLSLNEVGGDPDRFGLPPDGFHQAMQERQARLPWGLSATSTHDTKRSEDVRARLNVLSEVPDEWRQGLARWSKLNEPQRILVNEVLAPDANEEYFLYQTLIGAWPLETTASGAFIERIQAYMRKAMQEAKVHTSWINPNAEYDEAVQQFIARILDPQISQAFVQDITAFQKRVSQYGMFNSLSQLLVKIAAPGVPDFYQGTELWDFSLVDPDNRRPVDFGLRQELLGTLRTRIEDSGADLSKLAKELISTKEDGRIKLFATQRALTFRSNNPGLLTSGAYIPLAISGQQKEHIVAFARRTNNACAIAVVPRLLTRLVSAGQAPCGPAVWKDTRIQIPDLGHPAWVNRFTGETLTPQNDGEIHLPAAKVLGQFPIALLVGKA